MKEGKLYSLIQNHCQFTSTRDREAAINEAKHTAKMTNRKVEVEERRVIMIVHAGGGIEEDEKHENKIKPETNKNKARPNAD